MGGFVMSEPLVVATHASRWYDEQSGPHDALTDANCVILSGQRIALVGPSGSGKSTLLHLLGGLDVPSAGRVTWPAIGPIDALRPSHIAVIFQGPSLLPPFTALQNVALPLVLAGIDDAIANERALQALANFAVDHLRDKLPEELSGGQAQRVSIARALAQSPDLILADEPTGQLDSMTAEWSTDAIFSQLHDAGTAIVLATHDPAVAERCDLLWTIQDGILETPAVSTDFDASMMASHG
jgi:putative ABC transport system ATP-binding protein/lipoprotein-releasing system ATP-binding protein